MPPEVVHQVKTDFRSAPLDEPTRALLEFTEKVALNAYKVVDEDLNTLRRLGFTDDDIFVTTHIIGIFAHLVRLADTFGLELDSAIAAGLPNAGGRSLR